MGVGGARSRLVIMQSVLLASCSGCVYLLVGVRLEQVFLAWIAKVHGGPLGGARRVRPVSGVHAEYLALG